MANELIINCSLRHPETNKGGGNGPFRATVASSLVEELVQIVTTSAAALKLGGITTPGWIKVRNCSVDSAQIVRIKQGSASATNCIMVRPGQEACFEFDNAGATAPYVVSSSGSPRIEYTLTGPPS
jgi:hypothetical protein